MEMVKQEIDGTKSSSVMQRIMAIRIGQLPLPLYLFVAGVVYLASVYNKLPADMIGGFAITMVMGMLLAEIGGRIPGLKLVGGAAICALFVPSIMVYYNLINPAAMKSITALMRTSNFLYFYIACLVAGSILGMQRQVLIQGFLRMFIPLTVGTIAALAAGTLVGGVMGKGFHDSFFFVVIPILAGGFGEGILPLSMAYAEILGLPSESFLPKIYPAALLGNVVAIIIAGYLRRLGERNPELTGNGNLIKGGDDAEFLKAANAEDKPVDLSLMGPGLLFALSLYVFGSVASVFIPIPGPIIMIFSAALIKVFGIVPETVERGAYCIYRFVATNLTFALLVGAGVVLTPWKEVVAAITPSYILTCIAAVVAMAASGFYIGRFTKMYPVESGLVTCCHSGMGGTGDVAILTAGNRMMLMPFAQISTRIGGACTVIIAAILLRIWQ
ncbi:MAG: 2-hydroxycarboxylate transporter family protein [Negativicutes bacterium]